MMIPDDIKYYHSGDGNNCDPLQDLGGARSSCELAEGNGTLFNDLTGKQSRAGRIDFIDNWPGTEQPDYRCFYIKNTASVETLRNTKFYIDWEKKSGSSVDVGILLRDDIQKVMISGTQPPDEDNYIVLNLPTYGEFSVTYHVNITEWQGRFQTSIRGIDGLQGVIVEAVGEIGFPTEVTFTVNFVGQAESRQLQPMIVVTNGLYMQTINISQTQTGSPISVIACTIPSVTVAPACVDFDYPLRGNPIELGTLRPNEEFPVWVRRTTPKNTRALAHDEIRFNVDGTFP